MSKHTPGPWKACDNNGYSIWRITSHQYRAESASRTVAEVVGDSAETEANARLIAAAPEMYELIQQVADLQNPRFDDAAYNELVTEMDRLAELAQELLAKNEGGGE